MNHSAERTKPTPATLGRNPHSNKAGLSCRGFSTTNRYRMSAGGFAHDESDLFEDWIDSTLADEPDESMVENVLGMALKSKADDKSPLQIILDRVALRLPMYHVIVVFLDSELYLVLTRKRLWIHVYHKRVGGEAAHRRMVIMIKVS